MAKHSVNIRRTRITTKNWQVDQGVLNLVMTLTSHNHVGPSLHTVPGAVVFTYQLLPDKKASEPAKSGTVDEIFKSIDARAKRMTLTPAHIEGWEHGGLND